MLTTESTEDFVTTTLSRVICSPGLDRIRASDVSTCESCRNGDILQSWREMRDMILSDADRNPKRFDDEGGDEDSGVSHSPEAPEPQAEPSKPGWQCFWMRKGRSMIREQRYQGSEGLIKQSWGPMRSWALIGCWTTTALQRERLVLR